MTHYCIFFFNSLAALRGKTVARSYAWGGWILVTQALPYVLLPPTAQPWELRRNQMQGPKVSGLQRPPFISLSPRSLSALMV